ncbi:MAG: bis(5'-nucleosyl)-tetraphosphatase [Candidatus Hydrothermarchaeales archaeon]
MPVEISAGAIVFRRQEKKINYLLLHYESGHWDFAKGNVERGEEAKETVLREIEEETGIKDARFIEGFKEEISYFYKRAGKTIYKKVIFFLAETLTERVELSYEHIDYGWLGYEEALERLTYKNAKEVLKKADAFLSSHPA